MSGPDLRRDRRRLAATLAVWAGLLGAGGCEPDPCEGLARAATVEVGTGHLSFAALPDGAAVPYVRGIQGGTHVEGALRTLGLFVPADPFEHQEQLPAVTLTLQDERGALVAGYQEVPRALAPAGEAFELLGDPVIFFQDAATLVGAALRLAATVVDVCGNSAADEGTLVLTEPAS